MIQNCIADVYREKMWCEMLALFKIRYNHNANINYAIKQFACVWKLIELAITRRQTLLKIPHISIREKPWKFGKFFRTHLIKHPMLCSLHNYRIDSELESEIKFGFRNYDDDDDDADDSTDLSQNHCGGVFCV